MILALVALATVAAAGYPFWRFVVKPHRERVAEQRRAYRAMIAEKRAQSMAAAQAYRDGDGHMIGWDS